MLARAHRDDRGPLQVAGFSLVELLVVLAVVSVLSGILLPSLRAARQQARAVTCSARLQQWGVGFGCYAAENHGFFPHCDGLDRGPRDPDDPAATPEDLADWHGWVDVIPPLISHRPWREHPKYQRPKAESFYQCPAAELVQPLRLYGYYPLKDGYFSYAMNACLELDRNAWPPPGGSDYPMPSFLDSARIVWPAQVVLLFDQLLDVHKGYGGATVYREAGKYCGSYPIAFSARHPRQGSRLGGNLLFCDGHVGWQATVWKPEWGAWNIGQQQAPPRADLNWYPYPAEFGE